MGYLNADSRSQVETILKVDSVDELAFTGMTERYSISNVSKESFSEEGIFSFAFSFVKRGTKNAFSFSKSEWITLILVILLWAGTGILKTIDINITIFKPLAFFTASYNGIQTGALSILGGIIAKSFVLAAIVGTFIPFLKGLFFGKIRTEFTGFSCFFNQLSKIKINNLSHLAMLSIGVGTAFISYNFLSADGSFQNNFISILAIFSTIKNFGNKNNFFTGSLSRVFVKTSMSGYGTSFVMTGMTLGYVLSIPISLKLSTISGIGYITGVSAITVGVILLILGSLAGKAGKKI